MGLISTLLLSPKNFIIPSGELSKPYYPLNRPPNPIATTAAKNPTSLMRVVSPFS